MTSTATGPMNSPALNEAFNSLKFHRANEIVPGFAGVELKQDVRIRSYSHTMSAGVYYMRLSSIFTDGEKHTITDDTVIFDDRTIYAIDLYIDDEQIMEAVKRGDLVEVEDQDGLKMHQATHDDVELKYTLTMSPAVTFPDGHKLTIDELCLWLALEMAEAKAGEQAAQEMFLSLTGRGDKLPPMGIPTTAIVPVSKVAQTIHKGDKQEQLFSDKGLRLNISGDDKKPIVEVIAFEFDEDGLYSGITYDDVVLQEALASIYNSGDREFTATSVWRAMAGKTDPHKYPSETEQARIERLIKKQMGTRMTIDLTKVARAWKKPLVINGEEVKNPIMSPRLIEAIPFRGRNAKGEWVTWYQIIMPPALYMEAMALDQVSSYPIEALESGARDSPEKINWRHYIMRRVAEIKRSNKKLKSGQSLTTAQRRIRYVSIASATGTDIADKAKKKRLCDYCIEFCEGLAEKGMVAGAQEYYKKQGKGAGRAAREGIEFAL